MSEESKRLGLNFDFSCTGSSHQSTLTFNENRTFTSSGNSGDWSFAGDTIIFRFTNGTTYEGIEFSRTMKGRSTTFNNLNSLRGCWTATKISGTPTVETLLEEPLLEETTPVLGPDGEAN